MSLAYRLMYLVGFTPWDTDEVAAELTAVVEGPEALPAGRALDLGCGTGTQAVYLAGHGWRVTAIDAVDRALKAARRRGSAAGVDVDWRKADVAKLESEGLEPGFGLVHDRGCFHGLPPGARDGYARGVAGLAAPGATLLLMAFDPNTKPVGPSGASEQELRERFGSDWELVSATPITDRPPKGPMAGVPLTWYRFTTRD